MERGISALIFSGFDGVYWLARELHFLLFCEFNSAS